MLYGDFFTGAVPAGLIFKINVDSLRAIVEKTVSQDDDVPTNSLGVCFIGLIAYFEAFAKDHFASLVNICPQLLQNLKKAGHDVSIDAADLLLSGSNPKCKMGFVLAQRYDFGTAKRINAFYQGLLTITPFSKDEMARYDQLLRDRNLLVHHGGIYTTKYLEQRFVGSPERQRVFFDSLVLTREEFLSSASFLEEIARKSVKATRAALEEFSAANGITQAGAHKTAVEALTWWV
jgi:hypothetical protein